MRRVVEALALGMLTFAVSSPANAGRPRGGQVMTPFGPLYNTASPEWRQSGGNPMLYEQIMEQKAYQKQQQMMLKQQQQMLQMQRRKGLLNGPSGSGSSAFTAVPAVKRKKKHRSYDPTHPVTSARIKAAEKSGAATLNASPADAANTPKTP
jgi:hypothetical protein